MSELQKLAQRSRDQKASNDSLVADEESSVVRKVESKGPGDPFGDESNNEVKYKVMRWWQASMLMMAENISLGILSLPSVLATIGFVPGMILILGLGLLATYTGFVLGQFKMKYPHTHNMADAGEVLFGPIGREIFGAGQIIFLVFIMGSHVLAFTIMMNTLTGHGACSIVFGLIGAVACFLCTLPRRLGDMSWLAIVSFISIVAAVVVTMAGVGVEKPGHGQIELITQVSFYHAFLSITNIIFSYAGHVAIFSIISEFRDPADFPKALFLLQTCDTALYLIVAAVIYYYAGVSVPSPALGSTSLLLQKVAYGVAIPTIVISGVISGHVAAKFVYVRLFRGTGMLSQKTFKSYGSWALITFGLWMLAWIIAESVSIFNDLLGLISSLFGSWFTFGLSGLLWLFLNKDRYTESKGKMALTAANCALVIMGVATMALGLYASGASIKADSSKAGGVFSCSSSLGKSPP